MSGPSLYSRFTFCEALKDEAGRLYLSEREPFRYLALADNIAHRVTQGESLWTLADRYFDPLPRAAGLWWVIADFQPAPIFDPTVVLAPGSVIVVPSFRTVVERIFNEARRDET